MREENGLKIAVERDDETSRCGFSMPVHFQFRILRNCGEFCVATREQVHKLSAIDDNVFPGGAYIIVFNEQNRKKEAVDGWVHNLRGLKHFIGYNSCM
jgi:hypothetical protein